MNPISKYWRKYSLSLVIVVFFAILLILNRSENSPATVQIPASQNPASAEPLSTIRIVSSLKKTEQWKVVNDHIDLTTKKDPIVLNRTVNSVLYVLDQSLQFMEEGQQPIVLFHWSKYGSALVWKWKDGILIGLPFINADSGNQMQSGEWLYIHPSIIGNEEPPSAQIIANFNYKPEDLLEVRYSQQPHLAILTFQLPDSEAAFESFIDTETGISGSINGNERRTPSSNINNVSTPRINKTHEVRQIQAKQWDNELSTFSDERGTILFRKYEGNNIEASRYPFMKLVGYHFIYNETDKVNQLYLQLMDSNNHTYLNPYNSAMFASFEQALWEDGWKGLGTLSFYRLSSSQLETVQYDYLPIKNDIVLSKNTLPLASDVFQSQNQSILSFLHADQEQTLDIYDLLNLADNKRSDNLWLKALPTGVMTHSEKPSFNMLNEKLEKTAERINLPQYLESDAQLGSDLPDEIKSSVDTLLDPTGDYNANPLFRKFGDTWYWVIGDQLYMYDKSEKSKLLGTIPVHVSSTVAQAAALVGSKDFLMLGDNWIVLDTLGNRVLKLDQTLHIINEITLEAPFHLNATSRTQFEVESLNGVTLFDDQFKIIHTSPVPYHQALDTDLKERRLLLNDLNPQAMIRDKASGWIWYYDRDSISLYQYNSVTKKVRVFPIGYQRNFRIPVRLLKNGDQSVLLFDQYAYLFGKDGNWLKTIAYVRSEPDSLNDTTTTGEGTIIWDKPHEVVYLNQGYRILAIDLKLGTAATIFQQNMANTGPILLNGDQLIFTLQAKLYWGEEINKHSTTELINLNLTTNSYNRFKLDGYWEVEAVEDGKLKLWSFDEPRSGNYKGTYQAYSLDAFK